MSISEVHACWPPKYVMDFLTSVLIVNVAVKGNAKIKQRFSVRSWIGDNMSQIKLTEYHTMHQNANIGGTCMLATEVCEWPA